MPRERLYSESEVREAVESSPSLKQALQWLGLRPAGGNYATLRRLIAEYGISTEHMDPNWSVRGTPFRQPQIPLTEILVAGSSYSRRDLKRRLYAEGLKTRACELCGQGEEWRGEHMSLILDHINGVGDDNRIENLRIVCPNCNATLGTHCGRNGQNGPRDCLHCGTTFQPKYSRQQYCSQACGTHNPGPRAPKPEIRKVERPAYEDLVRELEQSNYSVVARRYGVSDNAVRKWVRAYEWQRAHGAQRRPGRNE